MAHSLQRSARVDAQGGGGSQNEGRGQLQHGQEPMPTTQEEEASLGPQQASPQQGQEERGCMTGSVDEEGRVVATMRVHGSILSQRSAYFRGLLLGAGAGMVEGQSKTVTVELADEQGGWKVSGVCLVSRNTIPC